MDADSRMAIKEWIAAHPQEFEGYPSGTKKLAIYGLSANPPHRAHASVVKTLVDTGVFSHALVLPVYAHMYSSKRKLEPFDHRMQMCLLGLCNLSTATSNCTVLTLALERTCCQMAKELNGGEDVKVDSAYVITVLNIIYPEASLSFVLGSDTFLDLVGGKWSSSENLINACSFEVVCRADDDAAALHEAVRNSKVITPQKIRYEIHSLAGSEDVQFLHTVSSTTIREAIRAVYGGTKAKARAEGGDVGEKTSETETSETETETEKEKEEKGALLIRSLVPEVLEYIREHNLFQA